MIRALAMVAVAGFILAVVALTGAAALGGPDAIARGGWTFVAHDDGDWEWGSRSHRHLGPETTRTLAWSGGDSLAIDIPADVEYTQADGPTTITVSGSQKLVDRVVIENGRITDKGGDFGWKHRHVRIVVKAPNITRFSLRGSSDLEIRDYRQDSLSLDIAGSGDVEASGEVRIVDLEIAGSGEADLASLKAKEADVEIAGSGEATIAPTDRANIEIAGSGDVTLTTNPKSLTTDVSGSGDIHHRGGGSDADATPESAKPGSAKPASAKPESAKPASTRT